MKIPAQTLRNMLDRLPDPLSQYRAGLPRQIQFAFMTEPPPVRHYDPLQVLPPIPPNAIPYKEIVFVLNTRTLEWELEINA